MKKILILEDELAYLNLLRDKLTKEGYNVIYANDGKRGLKMALQEKPDLILLDIRLPLMDGLTMLNMLRKDEWGKNANVIILTNVEDSKSISSAMHEIISKYIVKSETSPASLIEDVKIILKE